MEKDKIWFIISITLMIIGIVLIFLWIFGKIFGLIHSPIWMQMIPFFGGTITLIGIGAGVGKVLQKIEGMSKDIDKVECKIEKMGRGIEKMNNKIIQVDSKIDNLNLRVLTVETKLSQ